MYETVILLENTAYKTFIQNQPNNILVGNGVSLWGKKF